MGKFINFNGNLFPEEQPVFKAASRAARFGDGIFETMRLKGRVILFEDRHAQRLLHALQVLRFKLPAGFDWTYLKNEIEKLLVINDCNGHTRVRLMITRGEGAITEEPLNSPQFLIECWPTEKYSLNTMGLKIGIEDTCRKSMDSYSNIKSSNFLPSVIASIFARENGFDEALLLNTSGRVSDASISNVFWIKSQKIFTPPLSEGCIAGITRNYLIQELPNHGFTVEEKFCEVEELIQADEIFLTNTIRGIRWVEFLRESRFSNTVTKTIFQKIISPVS